MSSAWQQQQQQQQQKQQYHHDHNHNSRQQQQQQTRRIASATNHDTHPSSIASNSATCCQCLLVQSKFYCTICLSERIILQHADQRRLGDARQRAKNRVDILLGIVDAPAQRVRITSTNDEQQLPDPFVEPTEKESRRSGKRNQTPIMEAHCGASIQDRIARATIWQLQSDYDENTKSTIALQERNVEKRRRIEMQRRQLDRRKELLKIVKDDEENKKVMRLVSLPHVKSLRSSVLELQTEITDIAVEMSRRKSTLVQSALWIFDIQAPPISSIGAKTNPTKSQGTISDRSQRSRERYSGGAFAIDFSNAFDLGRSISRESKAKEEAATAKIHDWTIHGLALPIPADIQRIDRNEINGAIHHTVQLLQLVTSYLGITLPFIFSMQGSSPQIRANPLWGAGSKETLHLSEATYNSLSAGTSGNTVATTVGSMGASMISTLGASTLSTIESFVQLPSAKNLPWASKAEGSNQQQQKESDRNNISTLPSTPRDDPNTINARRFCTALTMLSFDVAYIVHLQGIKIDLIMAAGSVLRLISRALHSPDLGKRSHIAFTKSSTISTLQFSAVDFAQLSQIYDPGSNSSSKIDKRKLTTTMSSTTIMEESYVDARKAAESILDLKQSRPAERIQERKTTSLSTETIPNKTSSSRIQTDKISSLAAKRVQPNNSQIHKFEKEKGVMIANKNRQLGKGAIPPAGNTLDFLRARGQREVKTSNGPAENIGNKEKANNLDTPKQPTTAVTPPSIPKSTGTVTFNGKEIRGKAKSKFKGERHRVEEDGWHVL